MALDAKVPDLESGNNTPKPHIICVCQYVQNPMATCCGTEIPAEQFKGLPRNPEKWCNRCADLDTRRPVVCPKCSSTVRG